jgi:4-carboxymuconolactone decarboxylase
MAEMLDPKARIARGIAIQTEVTGRVPPEPQTLMESTWRDYVFAEVWDRPGLDRRSRFLIAVACAAMCDCSDDILDNYVRGALVTGTLTLDELRESALHIAVYRGWGRGDILDRSVSRVQQQLGLPSEAFVPVRSQPWDPAVRHTEGRAEFFDVMTFPGPQPDVPYHAGGILNFVFGEMWCRRGLDQRSRRWLTLVGVCDSGFVVPIDSHIHAAMGSGNCTEEELLEFVLQYALHAGWPKASTLTYTITTMAAKIKQGLPWNG